MAEVTDYIWWALGLCLAHISTQVPLKEYSLIQVKMSLSSLVSPNTLRKVDCRVLSLKTWFVRFRFLLLWTMLIESGSYFPSMQLPFGPLNPRTDA